MHGLIRTEYASSKPMLNAFKDTNRISSGWISILPCSKSSDQNAQALESHVIRLPRGKDQTRRRGTLAQIFHHFTKDDDAYTHQQIEGRHTPSLASHRVISIEWRARKCNIRNTSFTIHVWILPQTSSSKGSCD